MKKEKKQLLMLTIGCITIASSTIFSLVKLHSFTNNIANASVTKVLTQNPIKKAVLELKTTRPK